MSDTNALVDKLNEMAVYWSGDDYDTCREAAEKIESMQAEIDNLTMPNPHLLSDEQIENIQSKIPDWDDHEYSLSFARLVEAKVRAQYEI